MALYSGKILSEVSVALHDESARRNADDDIARSSDSKDYPVQMSGETLRMNFDLLLSNGHVTVAHYCEIFSVFPHFLTAKAVLRFDFNENSNRRI